MRISQTSLMQVASVFATNLVDQLRKVAPIHLDAIALSDELINGKMAVDYIPPTVLVNSLPIAVIVYAAYSTESRPYNFAYRVARYNISLDEMVENYHHESYNLVRAYHACSLINNDLNKLGYGYAKLSALTGNDGMNLSVGGYGKRHMV